MSKVRVWANISEETLHAYEEQARRLGVSPESLLEKTVNRLLHEMEDEIKAGGEDHPIIPS